VLLTLLFQTTPTLDITPANVLSALALCVALWLAFRKENREDGQTVAQRLKKLEARAADHDNLHTGQVQAREQLAGTMLSKMDQLAGDVDRRCAALERDTAKVEQMRIDMASMQEKLTRLPMMEEKLDALHKLLTHFLAAK
jgi:hypothetical protein